MLHLNTISLIMYYGDLIPLLADMGLGLDLIGCSETRLNDTSNVNKP